MPQSTLYRNGRVHAPGEPGATALLVTDGRLSWIGADADAPAADATVDRAASGRRAYLSRADAHSALASAALLAATPDVADAAGYDPDGWLRRDAHHAVRALARGSITPVQRREAQQLALRHAASL